MTIHQALRSSLLCSKQLPNADSFSKLNFERLYSCIFSNIYVIIQVICNLNLQLVMVIVELHKHKRQTCSFRR